MEGFSPGHPPDQSDWHPQPSELPVPPAPEVRDRSGLTPVERLRAGLPHLEQVVAQLAPDIQAGRWDAILGDDVSARIPTLILRQVIARSYAEQHRPAPRTYFVAMGQEFSYISDYEANSDPRVQQIKQYIASGDRPRRVLFVTDNVAMGGSIQTVQEAMDEIGIPSDVASVQVPADLLKQQTNGLPPMTPEAAQAELDDLGLPMSDQERAAIIASHVRGQGHAAHDPDARYYGVEQPVADLTPFHLSPSGSPRARGAVGVEKYGAATTEGVRHHANRQQHGGELQPDHAPRNPDELEIRQAAAEIADDLYRRLVATDQTHG